MGTHVAETTVALAGMGNRPCVPLIHLAPEPDCVAGLLAGAPEGRPVMETLLTGIGTVAGCWLITSPLASRIG